jgi:branched-chain amino acid transport system substrate-binding protein
MGSLPDQPDIERNILMIKRALMIGVAASALLASAEAVSAQEVLKLGLVQSMTGSFDPIGKEIVNGALLYLKQHGEVVAGRKIEVIVKDDASVPDMAKRLTQELIVNDKVTVLGAGGATPSALAIAPLVTEAKIPTVVMLAGASIVVERSPYMVRTISTIGQASETSADWAVKNGAKRIVTLVSDFAPGLEAEAVFKERAIKGGAQIVESIRVPLMNTDFAPFLQRARDLNPDTLCLWFPGFQAGIFAKQFVERGMDKSGIRIVGMGGIIDDTDLPGMTDAVLGIVTAWNYSAVHDSSINKSFVTSFKNAYGKRPGSAAVSGYDGMHLIFEALKKTGGKADGDAMIAAMKGMRWESPRGPIEIDPRTRDVVHNEYIRRVERMSGELWNVEIETYPMVKDPAKEVKG